MSTAKMPERHVCRHCGHASYPWGSILEHKPECLLRREAEAAIAKREVEEGKRKP